MCVLCIISTNMVSSPQDLPYTITMFFFVVEMPPLPASIVHSDGGGDMYLERSPPKPGMPNPGQQEAGAGAK